MLAVLPACHSSAPTDSGFRVQNDGGGKVVDHSVLRETVHSLNIEALPQTIRQEHEDRTNRLARLSRQFGAQAPNVQDNLQVDAGTIPGVNHPVPVIRVRYGERTFFDTKSAKVKPEARKILDVLAESMKRDMPDTNLLILGHTDSRGSNEYNMQLSLDRAKAVMSELARRGVSYEQMATVGIGELQPITSNATDVGMAQNRRVEFMISRFLDANLRLVEETEVNIAFLNDQVRPALPAKPVKILLPHSEGPIVIQKLEKDQVEVTSGEEGIVKIKTDKGQVGIKPEDTPSTEGATVLQTPPPPVSVSEEEKVSSKGATLSVLRGSDLVDGGNKTQVVKNKVRMVTLRDPVVVRLKGREDHSGTQTL